jgi:hypothetical protein
MKSTISSTALLSRLYRSPFSKNAASTGSNRLLRVR